MRMLDYLKQKKYCRENNTPTGCGCDGCPGENNKYCADWLINTGKKIVCKCDVCGLEYIDVRNVDILLTHPIRLCECGGTIRVDAYIG